MGYLPLAVIALLIGYLHAGDNAKPPNIVILLADDLGIGDVGCFGNTTLRTPNIDRLEREGVKLTHHLAAASMCSPSRSSLLTGRYAHRMGMISHHNLRVNLFASTSHGLPPNETTIAELAKDKGYSTAIIGKWHLGLNCESKTDFCHHPMRQGFDYWYGLPVTNMRSFDPELGGSVCSSQLPRFFPAMMAIAFGTPILVLFLFKMGYIGCIGVILIMLLLTTPAAYISFTCTHIREISSMLFREWDVVEQPIVLSGLTKRLVAEGNEFLEARHKDEKPFLLYMSWIQVHTALVPSKEFAGGSAHGAYGDSVEEMDWSVGEILNSLDQLGLADNTFVYFSSDQGGHLEEIGNDGSLHGGWNGIYRGGKGHGSMEGGIRVPTLVRWPGHIPADTVIDVPTSQMDLYPTMASVMNVPVPQDRIIDGVNILPMLSGKKTPPPHDYLFHYCGTAIHGARYTPPTGDDVWKVLYATPKLKEGTNLCDGLLCRCFMGGQDLHDPPLLYNIGKDPSEKNSLSVDDPAHKTIVEGIQKAKIAHEKSILPVPDQFSPLKLVVRPWLQPCCGDKFFPFCNCKDPKFQDQIYYE